MKYTINGFYQPELIRLGLDCLDAVILEYLLDLSVGPKIVNHSRDEKNYFWVKYDDLLLNLPILKIQKKALTLRMRKYRKNKVLEMWVLKNHKGTFSLYRFNPTVFSKLKYSKSNHRSPPSPI